MGWIAELFSPFSFEEIAACWYSFKLSWLGFSLRMGKKKLLQFKAEGVKSVRNCLSANSGSEFRGLASPRVGSTAAQRLLRTIIALGHRYNVEFWSFHERYWTGWFSYSNELLWDKDLWFSRDKDGWFFSSGLDCDRTEEVGLVFVGVDRFSVGCRRRFS